MGLSVADIVVVVLYFLVLIAIAGVVTIRSRKESSSQAYFLAGRHSSFWAIGCSLLSSNIGSEHLIGLVASGAKSGVQAAWGEWLSPFAVILLGWVFLPFYLRTQIFTMPEFLERRYSSHCRQYYAIVSLLLYVLTKVSVALFAGAVILRETMGWNTYVSASLLVVSTGAYTIIGGLATVIYTEVLQCIIMIGGGLALFVIGLSRVGGMENLLSSTPPDMRHLFVPASSPYFPWTGVFFGLPFTSIYYWCTDQVIVQRALSAKSLGHAVGGTLFAAYLKILPPFLMVFPGLIARYLNPTKMQQDPNTAFPYLVSSLLPPPLLGLMLAAMLAALMSSLASVFNSASTIFAMDIWRRLRGGATDRELVYVGRIGVIVITLLSLFWISLIEKMSEQLYIYTHKMMAYFAPPITVLFVGGVVSKRVNAFGAHVTLSVGLLVSITRVCLEIFYSGSNPFVLTIAKCNFLHFAIFFGWGSVFILFVASRFADPPPQHVIDNLTLSGYNASQKGENMNEFHDEEEEDDDEENNNNKQRRKKKISDEKSKMVNRGDEEEGVELQEQQQSSKNGEETDSLQIETLPIESGIEDVNFLRPLPPSDRRWLAISTFGLCLILFSLFIYFR